MASLDAHDPLYHVPKMRWNRESDVDHAPGRRRRVRYRFPVSSRRSRETTPETGSHQTPRSASSSFPCDDGRSRNVQRPRERMRNRRGGRKGLPRARSPSRLRQPLVSFAVRGAWGSVCSGRSRLPGLVPAQRTCTSNGPASLEPSPMRKLASNLWGELTPRRATPSGERERWSHRSAKRERGAEQGRMAPTPAGVLLVREAPRAPVRKGRPARAGR